MLFLTVVHGDIETPEEEETMQALRVALDGSWSGLHGTNDTTSWRIRGDEIPAAAQVVLTAAAESYSWWRVTVSRG